jgi:hypothetical protein
MPLGHKAKGLVQNAGGGKDERHFRWANFQRCFLSWEQQLLVGISSPVGRIQQNHSMLIGNKAIGDAPVPLLGPICWGGQGWEAFLLGIFSTIIFFVAASTAGWNIFASRANLTKPVYVAWT